MSASRIERVTVFREGARVVRALELDADATSARFANLPLAIDDGSIRASVVGEGTALDVHVALAVPEEDASLAPAEDAGLEDARVDAERRRAEIARLQNALARLESLRIVPRPAPRENEPPLPIPLETRQRLLAVRASEEERIGKALASAQIASKEAEKKLVEETERVRRATNARNAKRNELRKVAIVSLEGAKKGATVTLEYAAPGARWSPSYVITLAKDGAKLAMRALVAQRTGEDWSGVKLTLSTASQDAWHELPELAKSRIGRAQPRHAKRGYREPPEGAAALYADYDRAAGPPEALAAAEEETTPALAKSEAFATPMGGAAASVAPAMPAAPPMMVAMQAPSPSTLGAVRSASPKKGRVLSAPARAPAPAREDVLAELSDDGVTETRLPPREAPDWELAGEAQSFGRLRMFGPSDARRGELVAIAMASVYVEALGTRVQVDVAAAIRIALERTNIETALPQGHALAVTHDAYDYLYAAELPSDVASDGAFHSMPVAAWDAKTISRHVAVPREAQQVYRLLEIESPLDAALLEGPLDVYEVSGDDDDATYRTTARMPETPPRGRVEIGLGVEPAIKIARVTTFQEESAGLLGGSLALVHRVNVELRNLLPRAVTVEVRERVPIVRKDDAEVKIEVGSVEPAWEAWDQEQTLRGGHLWKVALDSGATKSLSARYTIKIASKLELVGGNRRES